MDSWLSSGTVAMIVMQRRVPVKVFSISHAADALGVSVETIRFYERKGLIEQPLKPQSGGARDYGGATLSRLKFIRQAQGIGFSLAEIKELLSLRADPDANCNDVRKRAIEKRRDVQRKLDHLLEICRGLDELIARCPGEGDLTSCSILDMMEKRMNIPLHFPT